MRYDAVDFINLQPIASPGEYTAKLSVDGVEQSSTFKLSINPHETYTKAQIDAKKAEIEIEGKELDNVEKKLDITLKTQELKDLVKGVARESAAGAVQQTLEALGVGQDTGQTTQ